jgi:hypothetical protein
MVLEYGADLVQLEPCGGVSPGDSTKDANC